MKYIYTLLGTILLGLMVALYLIIRNSPVYGNLPPLTTYFELAVNMMNMIAGMFAITIIAGSFQKHSKSTFGKILLYFIFGTIILTLGRLFIMTTMVNIFTLKEEVIDIVWHYTFYFAIFLFFIGIQKLHHLTAGNPVTVSAKAAYGMGIASCVISAAIIFTAPGSATLYEQLSKNPMIEQYGFQHVLSFVLAGATTFFLWRIQQKKTDFRPIITSFLVAFIFLALVHFWELLTETWQLIPAEENILILIRELLSLPTFIFISRAFMQDIATLDNASAAQTPPSGTPEKQ